MNEIQEKEFLQALCDIVIEGNYKKGKELAVMAMSEGLDPYKAIVDGLARGMARIGELYERKECFVPEMMLAAKVMEHAIEVIKPHLTRSTANEGTVVIGTIANDIHDIGKNIVALMFRNLGFIVHDLGINVDAAVFADKAIQTKADFICMSALMTTTMQTMKTNIEFFKQRGLREKVKIIVGGAPVTEKFARLIGADGYADDAFGAVKKAKELAKESKSC